MARAKRSFFQFKQFKVFHDRCAMKVGTDGVLLGAWVNITDEKSILDVGTGSGVIALMLAQRTTTSSIDALEIAEPDFLQARENVVLSPWPNRISVHHTALQNFTAKKTYDLIVSNPPFFQNSQLPPSPSRANARHNLTLSQDDFLQAVLPLLNTKGRLAIILSYPEGNQFRVKAETTYGLNTIRQLSLFSKKSKPQERWLFEFSRQAQPIKNEVLVIHEGDQWSDPYQELTRAFYLNF